MMARSTERFVCHHGGLRLVGRRVGIEVLPLGPHAHLHLDHDASATRSGVGSVPWVDLRRQSEAIDPTKSQQAVRRLVVTRRCLHRFVHAPHRDPPPRRVCLPVSCPWARAPRSKAVAMEIWEPRVHRSFPLRPSGGGHGRTTVRHQQRRGPSGAHRCDGSCGVYAPRLVTSMAGV